MARKQVDASKVVWLAPETLNQDELAAKLADVDSPEQALEILNSRPTTGEYREFLGDEIVENEQGAGVISPKFGDRVVWVDDAPDDRENPEGHFERYSGSDDEYAPTRKAE